MKDRKQLLSRLPFRARAAAGIAGPAAFTGAWVYGTIKEEGKDGYTVKTQNISGLAAHDAQHPAVMTAGFMTTGFCTMLFASAVQQSMGGPRKAGWAPRLMRITGAATIGAGLFRRDEKLLIRLDQGEHQSTQNNIHDACSAVAFASMFCTPLAMRSTLKRHEQAQTLAIAGLVAQLVSTAVLVVFQSKAAENYNGILQRVAVTLPMLSGSSLAIRMLKRGAPDS